MTALAKRNGPTAAAVEGVLVKGDLASLSEAERVAYYQQVCESIGLNPLTQPFGYIEFQGKLRLYALRACTDQLRKLHGVSVVGMEQKEADGILSVTVCVQDGAGRRDSDVGCVVTASLKGEALANARMKCITKAKRRATLSICGLGWLDESELDTLPEAQTRPAQVEVKAAAQPAKLPPESSPKPLNGPELLKKVRARDDTLAKQGKILKDDLLNALDFFASSNSYPDAEDEWTDEHVRMALAHLSEWEQKQGFKQPAAVAK